MRSANSNLSGERRRETPDWIYIFTGFLALGWAYYGLEAYYRANEMVALLGVLACPFFIVLARDCMARKRINWIYGWTDPLLLRMLFRLPLLISLLLGPSMTHVLARIDHDLIAEGKLAIAVGICSVILSFIVHIVASFLIAQPSGSSREKESA